MTIQKAMDNIEEILCSFVRDDNSIAYELDTNDCNWIEMAKSALEKQIPKKPITETINRGISASGEYDIDINYLCSNCLAVVGDYEANEAFYKFCPECGHALGWEEAVMAIEERNNEE
ncbi:MAG: hypothetical protein EGR79_00490 [Ruminococcaceae bacterium]|nr:hypothetical protein [Oscillospiraceae bacterium]